MEEDIVELILDGDTIVTAKDYNVSIAFLQVPNIFSMTIGSGRSVLDLMRRFPKNTPFTLKINDVVQFMGFTDGFRRPKGDASAIEIYGRDALAQLVTDKVPHDRSFNNVTFDELTHAAFKSAQYGGISLSHDAASHRKAVTGVPQFEPYKASQKYTSQPIGNGKTVQEVVLPGVAEYDIVNVRTGVTVVSTETQVMKQRCTGFKTEKPIEWKAGQTHYEALNKDLARGGIFLRAGVDPEGQDPNVFLLGEPNAAQAPMFGLARLLDRDPPKNMVNVQPPQIEDSAVGRHAYYIVRGRTGGGKDGKQQIEAIFEDEDMIANGYTTRNVVVDEQAKTKKQAEYIARKLCAEARRMNRVFTYTVPGRHSLPLLSAPSRRAIPNPDLVVSLIDEEHGLEGDFWVERVKFRASASGGTFTDITLMVPDDLVFGEGEFYTSARKKRKVFGRSV